MARIALIPGDGVGPEVMAQAVRVLELVRDTGVDPLAWDEWDLGADRFLRTGVTISDAEFQALAEDYDAILLGALGDPRVPSNEHARDILLGLRFRLDLYVNYRPCRLLHPASSPLKVGADRPMDLRVFRENTEGVYVGIGGVFKEGTPDEVAIQEDLNTRKGVERIIRAAFEHALAHGLDRVTLVDKANAMPSVGSLWRRTFQAVAAEFPVRETRAMYVDAMAMDLVRNPDAHQVVVTSNLFGDILSDLAAVLTGGLGIAPSANLHPGQHALFEPVHGSAPDIAGSGTANPMAAILCVALLMEYLGHEEVAVQVERAVTGALAAGQTTRDLGGGRSTEEVGSWIAERFAAGMAGVGPGPGTDTE
jgi:3-isopropylmalate dehydrogenase